MEQSPIIRSTISFTHVLSVCRLHGFFHGENIMESKRSIPIDYTLVEEFLDQECEAEPDYLLRGLTWVRKTVAKRLMPEGRKRSPYSR